MAPLPEEERDPGCDALVPQIAHPLRVHRSGTGADLAAGDDPVECSPCRPFDQDRPAATVDGVMAARKSVEIAVADEHRLGPDLIEQRLETNPSYRGRGLQQIADAGYPVFIPAGDAEPEIGHRPALQPPPPHSVAHPPR